MKRDGASSKEMRLRNELAGRGPTDHLHPPKLLLLRCCKAARALQHSACMSRACGYHTVRILLPSPGPDTCGGGGCHLHSLWLVLTEEVVHKYSVIRTCERAESMRAHGVQRRNTTGPKKASEQGSTSRTAPEQRCLSTEANPDRVQDPAAQTMSQNPTIYHFPAPPVRRHTHDD